MKNNTTKKGMILRALKATKGKKFSYKEMAKELKMKESTFRSWLWCLDNRDAEICVLKEEKGIARVIMN